MSKVPDIVPVSDLRQDAAAVLKRINSSHEPVIITQRGRATAVMLDIEAYRQGEEEREILKVLARGDREIQTGKGSYLDTVLKKADLLLNEG
jgi:prevent-host-death family protein